MEIYNEQFGIGCGGIPLDWGKEEIKEFCKKFAETDFNITSYKATSSSKLNKR